MACRQTSSCPAEDEALEKYHSPTEVEIAAVVVDADGEANEVAVVVVVVEAEAEEAETTHRSIAVQQQAVFAERARHPAPLLQVVVAATDDCLDAAQFS